MSLTPISCKAPSLPSTHVATDEELVATLLSGAGGKRAAKGKAARLLDEIGGLAGLARLGDTTRQIGGLSPSAAQRLVAAVELGLRCAEPSKEQSVVVSCSEDIVGLLSPRLRHLMHEQVWMVGLDGRNGVLSRCRIAEGGQHGCALLARDVLRAAVQLGAHAFVLVHNHPGGDPRPSAEDVHLTEQIATAALCVGIPLIDHIILTRTGHSSLLKLGLIPDLAWEGTKRGSGQARVASKWDRDPWQG